MIKDAKKTAHLFLDSHFSLMFPIYLIWLVFYTLEAAVKWAVLPYLFKDFYALFIAKTAWFLIVSLTLSPFYVGIVKAAILAIKNQPVSVATVWDFYKNKISYKNAIIVNFVPLLLNYILDSYRVLADNKLILGFIAIVFALISSLFFLAAYSVITQEKDAITAIRKSIRVMSSKLPNYLLFELSFVPWYLIAGGIAIVFGFVFHINAHRLGTATQMSFGLLYGLGVYFYPYLFLARAVYADKLLYMMPRKGTVCKKDQVMAQA